MPEPLVTDKSYAFVPPDEGRLWQWLLKFLSPTFLRRLHGVTRVELRDSDKLRELIRARHGILLTPNHCRMADALVLQALSRKLGQPFFVMASSHLFRGSRILAWAMRKMGAFSVYREGVDRDAVSAAIDILIQAKRPLVIFPEGALSQANDRLNALMEGVSFIASATARKLDKQSPRSNGQSDCDGDGDRRSGKIVTVPIAIRYLFKGDFRRTIEPLLADIERRLSWRPQGDLPLVDRIYKLGHSLLTLKELEYFGRPQTGELDERLKRLINHLLCPLEAEWLGTERYTSVISRVKELRKAMLPEMIEGDLADEERDRRWRQFEDMELAQQLSLYPPRYIASHPTVERMLETVERFAENLSGDETPHPPITAIVQVGNPIEVSAMRRRDSGGGGDPLLEEIETQLTEMLESLTTESHIFEGITT
ncbi:MAG: lysophospholipid acyltransferase family protein [Planctomycetota bacterium]|jgi:1-acyl-sn-glycerol-3-phosphate acyltransferase